MTDVTRVTGLCRVSLTPCLHHVPLATLHRGEELSLKEHSSPPVISVISVICAELRCHVRVISVIGAGQRWCYATPPCVAAPVCRLRRHGALGACGCPAVCEVLALGGSAGQMRELTWLPLHQGPPEGILHACRTMRSHGCPASHGAVVSAAAMPAERLEAGSDCRQLRASQADMVIWPARQNAAAGVSAVWSLPGFDRA